MRPRSQHKQCSLCVKHKEIIKRLANDSHARAAQMKEYAGHLRRQYQDRTRYWSERSQSRLCQPIPSGERVICLVVDGLDHSKMKFPRADNIMSSKDMSQFNRPNLDLQACLCHGYGVFLLLTWPTVAKDSCLTADLLAHVLHEVASSDPSIDFRSVALHLQSDNTTRETKNNGTLRLLASWVGGSLIKRSQYSCLMSGHSHEDIDQFFSVVSSWIQDQKLLETPEDFKATLEKMLQNKNLRPYEPLRKVDLINSVRDWTL